jgi:hypothetical protein
VPRVQHWKTLAATEGPPIVVTDYDGPHAADGSTQCLEISVPMLRERFFDTRRPFGHGYIVAAMLSNIDPEEYTSDPIQKAAEDNLV